MNAPRFRLAPSPACPPLRTVAEHALELAPDDPLRRFCEAIPGVRGWMERVAAERHYGELRGLDEGERLVRVARRAGRSSKTIRRWLTGQL